MTGVPTSLRFLARSWRSIARGPGGIVTETPGQKHFTRNKMPDFSGTVNMLTVLAKADIKLKSQMKEEEESLAEKGKAHNRRRLKHTHFLVWRDVDKFYYSRSSGAAVMDKNRLSPKHPRTKSNSNVGLYPERKGSSSSRASTLRTDSDLNVCMKQVGIRVMYVSDAVMLAEWGCWGWCSGTKVTGRSPSCWVSIDSKMECGSHCQGGGIRTSLYCLPRLPRFQLIS